MRARSASSTRARVLVAPALVAVLALGCDATLPPLPEVVLEVDTDLPVPLAVSKLRVDLFTEHGTWFDSADIARPDPRDWPVSFGVYSDDPSRTRRVWVRLRGYLDGHTRDVRADAVPRLVKHGKDVTPSSEPEPLVTVDRLVLVELEPDQKSYAHVVLRGACAGTPASFGSDPAKPALGEATSCVDSAHTDAKVKPLHTSAEPSAAASAQGTWLDDPACPPEDPASARACIRGGATILGTRDLLSGIELATQPVRLFGLHRYHLDRDEVSVGRFRAAVAAGLTAPMPLVNDGPLGDEAPASCTWSDAPLGREDYALNCVSWATARAFCRFTGGDLPTEAQWEHAATVAGHDRKVNYPWGNDEPDCDRAAFGRAKVGGSTGQCVDKGPNPPAPSDSARDLSPLGVRALAAGLSEWVLDVPAPYDDPCWTSAPLLDPHCGDPDAPSDQRSIRGANYILPEMVHATARFLDDASGVFAPVGFRCAYPEAE